MSSVWFCLYMRVPAYSNKSHLLSGGNDPVGVYSVKSPASAISLIIDFTSSAIYSRSSSVLRRFFREYIHNFIHSPAIGNTLPDGLARFVELNHPVELTACLACGDRHVLARNLANNESFSYSCTSFHSVICNFRRFLRQIAFQPVDRYCAD